MDVRGDEEMEMDERCESFDLDIERKDLRLELGWH
jgi:hypothetical protein